MDIVPSYHPIWFKQKLMNQTQENSRKLNFGPACGPFGPNLGLKLILQVLHRLDIRHWHKLSEQTYVQTQEND